MGLFENVKSERVSSLNLRDPVLVKPTDNLRDTVQKMREHNLGCAILIDDDRRPAGMFTENMLTQIVSNHPEAMDDQVDEHAAKPWPQVKLSDPIAAVLEALELKNIRFLSVVDDDGCIAGLTGQKGLMEYVADHFPQVTVQRVGQSPTMHAREGA